MATRLYPNTKNPAILEKLAGVPAGTAARLEAIQKRQEEEMAGKDFFERNEIGFRHFQEMHETPEGDLSTFLTFGWGRVDMGACPDYSGSNDDEVGVAQILRRHPVQLPADVTVAELEGVHWC